MSYNAARRIRRSKDFDLEWFRTVKKEAAQRRALMIRKARAAR